MQNLSRTRIKICGITNMEDAEAAVGFGADALGFIFYKGSKRYVDPETAGGIISTLPPFLTTVGVFVNQDLNEIREIMGKTGINAVQLHGDEDPQFCNSVPTKVIKVFRVKDTLDPGKVAQYPVQAILLDTYSDDEYGGTGRSFDWTIIEDMRLPKKVILSGGLTPDNVSEAVRIVNPYAVDVSSGVEAEPGKKDHQKLKNFIEAINNGN